MAAAATDLARITRAGEATIALGSGLHGPGRERVAAVAFAAVLGAEIGVLGTEGCAFLERHRVGGAGGAG